MPLNLLKVINDMFNVDSCTNTLCCTDEPHAYVLYLKKIDSSLDISVSMAKKDSNHILFKSDALMNEELETVLFNGHYIFNEFAHDVFKAFDFYCKDNGLKSYKEHWMPFPTEEFVKLKNRMLYRY